MGVVSYPAYRLGISLSADWNQPGKTRRPAPGKASHFLQVRDASRYPVVSDARLVAMTFPVGTVSGSAYRMRLQRARRALEWLVGRGFAQEVRLPNGRRIIPGPKWTGWEGGTY